MTECSDQSKTCTRCKLVKSLSEFPKSSRYKSGFNSRCKYCCNSHNKEYRDLNFEQFSEMRKTHYQKNIDKMRSEKRAYISKTKPQKSLYDTKYRKDNKVKIATYKKEWEKLKRHEPLFKIKRNLRRRVHHALMGNNKSDNTIALLGCSIEFFKLHLEGLWEVGMDWTNYSPSGWHIDHIKECHSFDLSDPLQQQECFHYSNQRPLWAKDNLSRPKQLRKYNIHKSHQSHQE